MRYYLFLNHLLGHYKACFLLQTVNIKRDYSNSLEQKDAGKFVFLVVTLYYLIKDSQTLHRNVFSLHLKLILKLFK